MSFTTFLLRLVGQHPEQVKEQKRFEDNLKELEVRDKELDGLLQGIREIDQAVQEKTEALSAVTSARPEANDREQDEYRDVLLIREDDD